MVMIAWGGPPNGEVRLEQAVKLRHPGLEERHDHHGLLGAGRDVADPELQGLEMLVGLCCGPSYVA